MLGLPIIRDRFRDAVILPWHAQPTPLPSPPASPWPLVGMFGMGLGLGIALGSVLLSFDPARQQLQRLSERLTTTAGGLVTPIRERTSLSRDRSVQPEAGPALDQSL
ncbi:MAG: hypothetical protein JF888_03970 [Candidatus Dormibacteraeota bacterium]|uniref:Uncharacterized protein n=1 Tax=Candidatus Dormiibacter inghamiae TaxID=3127013 RepID=A0A934KGA3_9BACT|nr:hypothetical protein [Candidatus Dormibacteraeota bacterium]MBJ7604946.1 hypothetical protein [Candidatus Dormibacteraeota bacterium]